MPAATDVAPAPDRRCYPPVACDEERVALLGAELLLPEIHRCLGRSRFGMVGLWKSVFVALLYGTPLEDTERMTGQCECTSGQRNLGWAA